MSPSTAPTAELSLRDTLRDAAGDTVATAEAVARLSGPAGSRQAIVLALNCFVDDLDLEHDEKIDIEFHPVRAPVGSHHQRYFVGAIVFNTLIVVGLVIILLFAIGVQARGQGDKVLPLPVTVQAIFRFPSAPFIPYEFLSQGTALAAGHCAFFPARGTPGTQVLGVVFLALVALAPTIIWCTCLWGPRFRARALHDPWLAEHERTWEPWQGKAYRAVYGSIIWVSTQDRFVERFGLIFEVYKPGLQWWTLPELQHLTVICLFAAWRPQDQMACDARNFLVAGVLLLYLLALLKVRPYLSPLTFVLQAAIALQNTLAVLFIAAGLSAGRIAGLLRAGSTMLVISACFQFVLLCCEVAAYIFDLCIGRRARSWTPVETEQLPIADDPGEPGQPDSGDDESEGTQSTVQAYEPSGTPLHIVLPASREASPLEGLSSGRGRSASFSLSAHDGRRRHMGGRGLGAATTPAETPLLASFSAASPGVLILDDGFGGGRGSMNSLRKRAQSVLGSTAPSRRPSAGRGSATPPAAAGALSRSVSTLSVTGVGGGRETGGAQGRRGTIREHSRRLRGGLVGGSRRTPSPRPLDGSPQPAPPRGGRGRRASVLADYAAI